MYKTIALIHSLASLVIHARRPCTCQILDKEIIELTHVRYCYYEVEVRSSSVSVVYVVCA